MSDSCAKCVDIKDLPRGLLTLLKTLDLFNEESLN